MPAGALVQVDGEPLRKLAQWGTNPSLDSWVASAVFYLVAMDGKDFEILASNRYPPAGGNVVGADEIKSREPVFPFDLRDVLSIEGLCRFQRLAVPERLVGSRACFTQAVRLVSRVSAAWGQRSTIWLSFDFEAESRLPENEGLGLRRASDFGFRRTVFDADGNRFDRGGLWIDLSVKWPEEAEQEWEKNRFSFSEHGATMSVFHGEDHEKAIRDFVLKDMFTRKPFFLVMHGASMDIKWLQAKMQTYAPWTLPELGVEGSVTTVDTQYLYAALEMTTGEEPDRGWSLVSLKDALVRYQVCDPSKVDLHNAANDAYWTMELLEALVQRARRFGCHVASAA